VVSHKPITNWPHEAIEYDKEIEVEDEPHGWIQWKGTNVCMDIHCSCGHHSHVDLDFLYFFRCPNCKKTFAVGQTVRLYEMDPSHPKSSDPDVPTDTTEEWDR
jgi:hypothetical protein